jgi:hypothetical protein
VAAETPRPAANSATEPSAEPGDEPAPVPDRPAHVVAPAGQSPALGDGQPPAALGGYGLLSITAEPWARVFLDGRDLGRTTPVTRLSTPVGHHTIELRARTGAVTVEVDIEPHRELSIDRTIGGGTSGE